MYQLLKDLPPRFIQDTYATIKVKVFRKVKGRYTTDDGTTPTLSFLLVDEEGTKIHAAVNDLAYGTFEDVPEGAWIKIASAVVSSATWKDPNHLLSTHMSMLIIPSTATCSPIPPLSDHHFFNFTSFEEVNSGFFNIAYPIDLIGTIHTVGKLSPTKNSAGAERSIPFTITNARNVELYCIAYGRVAEEFSYHWLRPHGAVVRCILSEWRVSRSRVMHSMSYEDMIVDGGEYCRFWFDPDMPGLPPMVRRNEGEDANFSEVVEMGDNSSA
ncbi:unnamed protein product [Microthlaspi erraticum]|uniref:DUF223 domain-containing protein n=1 Tax=Microthlaspi erraticum TaxID=1685480 RepID=A0A6D2IET7_9BRAS|nr:unnamed protein product [Microthlaspi erraticum]